MRVRKPARLISPAIQFMLSCIGLCLLNVSFAEDSSEPLVERANWQALVQLDNDLFAGQDRDYTNGIRFAAVQEIPLQSLSGQRFQKRIQDNAKRLGLSRFQNFRFDDDSELRFARGIGLTQLMFTPQDSQALRAPDGQRPYAGWLGLEYSTHVKSRDYVNSVTLSLGTTGEASQAEDSQNWVHENVSNSPLFQGWDSQVPEEVTFNIFLDHKQRFRSLSRVFDPGWEMDGYYELGLGLGNFRTDAYLGSVARFGYRLPQSFNVPRVELGGYGHELFPRAANYQDKFSVYSYAGIRATAVAHDITLDGPVFRRFDTGTRSKSWVGEFVYGAGVRYKQIDLIYGASRRSKEFVGQSESTQFGSFMIRFQTNFN